MIADAYFDEEELDITPGYEPEDCEYCSELAEDSGIEYEANFYHDGETWYCSECKRPL